MATITPPSCKLPTLVAEKLTRTSPRLWTAVRYVGLVSAGICVFLGLVILAGLAGVRWHSNYQWVKLDAYVISRSGDLTIWSLAFGLSVLPFYSSVVRNRSWLRDRVLVSSNLALPLASMVMFMWSYVGAFILLVSSGFLVAYGLATRSSNLLRISGRDALRIIGAVTLVCVAGVSLIGTIGLAVGGAQTLQLLSSAWTVSDEVLSNPWLRMIILDLEFFFLFRPELAPLLVVLALAGILSVLWDTLSYAINRLRSSFAKSSGTELSGQGAESRDLARRRVVPLLAVLLIVGSVLVGAYVTLYPYVFGHIDGVLGSDSWDYLRALREMQASSDVLTYIRTSDRPLFIFFLFCLKYMTGANALSVIVHTPLILSALLSLSAFVLVRQGTKDTFFASVAALFSAVSTQTAIGLGAGIFANWFAFTMVNIFFALLIKAQMDRSRAAIMMAPLASLLVLLAHPYVWGASMAVVAIQGVAVLLGSRLKLSELKRDGIPLASVILVNVIFLYLASTMVPAVSGSARAAQSALRPHDLSLLVILLDRTIDYARNRLDATIMVILSIVGILDVSLLPKPFRRVLAGMMIVPVVFTLLAPDIGWTWRGLYLLPLYLGGALGTRSIVVRANSPAGETRRGSVLRVAFSGSLLAYVFLSSLAWTLRSVILLMETSGIAR